MIRALLTGLLLIGAAVPRIAFEDFERPLDGHWIVSRPSRVRIVESGDAAHRRVLSLEPDGDDVFALLKDTEGWSGGMIEGDVCFPSNDDSYLGIIYNFDRGPQRTDFGVIYIKGNESYAQANPHYDFNVSRTLYPEYRVPLGGAAAIRAGEWQHFRVEAVGTRAHLYVGDMAVPQMTFALFPGVRGAFGLQPRSVGGEVQVDNVGWRPLTALTYSGPDRPLLAYDTRRLLTSWRVAGPFAQTDDRIARDPGVDRQWREFSADLRGAIMTATVNAFHGDRTVSYFHTRVSSPVAREAALVFSTADDLALWVNGRFWWFVPRAPMAWFDFLTNPRHAGQRIPIALAAGANDIVVRARGGSYATGGFFAAIDDAPAGDALMRAGRYADAARAWGERLSQMNADDPDREDLENRRALYGSLADVPPQTITFERPNPTLHLARNALGTWNVHVSARGRETDWIFDTGANLSTLVQSEAEALGLRVRESPAFVRGSTGAKNNLRLAVAPELRIGAARLTNVIFLVLPDQALYIAPMKYQIRGILGMPVLYALGRFSLGGDGTVRINPERSTATPNVMLDGWSPIVDVMHNDRRLRMLLDTGANVTSLYPSARKALTEAEVASLIEKKEQSGGAGEIVTRTTDVVPALRLQIGGSAIDLQNVTLLRSAPAGDDRDGVLGMDLLRNGFSVDFGAGVLTLPRE